MNPSNELQGLNYLDVTGNEHWLPGEQLLQLSNLTTVEGVRLSQYCQDCSLCKTMSGDVNSLCPREGRRHRLQVSYWVWADEIQYGKALDFVRSGFWPTCLTDHACWIDQTLLPYFTSVADVAMKLSFALYATGSVALLVNIAVILLIIFNKSLRNHLPVCLLLNVTVCDAFIALVAILCRRFNFAIMYTEYLLDQLQGDYLARDVVVEKWKRITNIMGPLLACAMASSVFVSVILMFDKFLKIVFVMKPDLSLRRKTAVVLLVLSWPLSATFAVLPVFDIGGMTYTEGGEGSITPLPTDHNTTGFAAGSQIALVILQLASFLLYIPIFIVAKNSGANVGMKREAAIARKIALLLCTNLIFFTVPIILDVSRNTVYADIKKDTSEDWRNWTLVKTQWYAFLFDILPFICLSVNSLLNPFLYALRHPKVRQQLNPLLSRCGAAARKCFGTLRQNVRRSTTNVEPINNEVQMREERIHQHAYVAEEKKNEVQRRPIPLECSSHAREPNIKVESEDTRL